MIKIANTEDFGFVCLCAVRYCLGRRTYAPGTVMDFIKTFLPALDDKTLRVMARDISGADNLGDSEIKWAEFLEEIKTEWKRRKTMKTPDEIKKAVSLCILCECSEACPYYGDVSCSTMLMLDVFACIEQLEAEREVKNHERNA